MDGSGIDATLDRQWESFEERAAECNKGTSHVTLDSEQAVWLTSVEANNSPLL